MVEQRHRAWSTTRLKAKIWRLPALRFLKNMILLCGLLAVLIFCEYLLQSRVNKADEATHDMNRFLHVSHNWPSFIGRENPQLFETTKKAHVCLDNYQGGLGNRMFQYAAAFVAATRSNKTVKLSVDDALALPFETSAVPFYFFRCYGQTLAERLPCAYDERLLQTTTTADDNVRLHGYWQSWKYFRHQEIDLRREFKFSPKIARTAETFLSAFSNFTLVGVHIRRGDMISPESIKYGYNVPTPHYFHKAMKWFRRRFTDALFIVCSNDMEYAKQILGAEKDAFFSENHSTAEDLAILSRCVHTVMSVGTYGWWGGWLAGGTTIYYKNYARAGSLFAEHIVADDFFPPTWIGME